MEKRGQMSMLTWYMDSTAQYELPGDRVLLAFKDDMTVSIFRKSTDANLKTAGECLQEVFGRPVEQLFALEKDAEQTIDAANKEAAKSGGQPEPAAVLSTPGPVLTAPGPDPAETAAEQSFRNGAEYFQKLSEKMNFPIEWK
jgi:hypothetical protein